MLSLLSSLEEGEDEDEDDLRHVYARFLLISNSKVFFVQALKLAVHMGEVHPKRNASVQWIGKEFQGSQLLKVGKEKLECSIFSSEHSINLELMLFPEVAKLLVLFVMDSWIGVSRQGVLKEHQYDQAMEDVICATLLAAKVEKAPLAEKSLEKEKAKRKQGSCFLMDVKVGLQPGEEKRCSMFILEGQRFIKEIFNISLKNEQARLLMKIKGGCKETVWFSCSQVLFEGRVSCFLFEEMIHGFLSFALCCKTTMVIQIRSCPKLKVDGEGKISPVTGSTGFIYLEEDFNVLVHGHYPEVHASIKKGLAVLANGSDFGSIYTHHVSDEAAERWIRNFQREFPFQHKDLAGFKLNALCPVDGSCPTDNKDTTVQKLGKSCPTHRESSQSDGKGRGHMHQSDFLEKAKERTKSAFCLFHEMNQVSISFSKMLCACSFSDMADRGGRKVGSHVSSTFFYQGLIKPKRFFNDPMSMPRTLLPCYKFQKEKNKDAELHGHYPVIYARMWKGPSVHAARNVFADQDTQHMSQGSVELHTYMPRNLDIAVERSSYLLPFIVCLYPDIVLFMEYPPDFNNLCFSRQGKDASLFSFAADFRGKDVHAPLASRNGPFMDVGWFSHRVRPIMEISQQKVCCKSPILDAVNHAPLVIVSFPHMEMLLFKSFPTNPHVILLIFKASTDSFLGPTDIAHQPSRFSQGPTVSAMHSMVHVFSTSRALHESKAFLKDPFQMLQRFNDNKYPMDIDVSVLRIVIVPSTENACILADLSFVPCAKDCDLVILLDP